MTVPTARSYPWERRMRPLLAVGPYVLLAALAAFTTVIERSATGPLLVDLSLCALAAAWMLWMVTLHPSWQERPKAMAVFVAGLIAITAVLVVRDPWFALFTPAVYHYTFRLIEWPWELAGVSAVAVVAGTAQASGIPKTSFWGVAGYVAVLAVNVLPMCGLVWLGRRSDLHDRERERALGEVSEANRRLEATLAENTALHERLVAQAREAGVADERRRMAREIHDTLAQGLTGIITQLQAAEQAEEAGDDPAQWRRHVRAATRLARESLSEARRSVHALRPEPLEAARLGDALAGVAERWSALHGITVRFTTTGTPRPMPPEADVALLRTAQEALANVAKHAQAGRVGLTLSYMADEVALDVRDDGRGFAPAGDPPAKDGGFGLVAMRQRIERLSGTLQVESEPGAGTAISACVPAAPAGVPA